MDQELTTRARVVRADNVWVAVFALVGLVVVGCAGVPALTGAPGAGSASASASAGCGATTVRGGTSRDHMTVAGTDRSWVLHVPAAHDGRTPLPLVIQLHGYGGDVADMEITGLDALGDADGFVVATPAGRGSKPHWLFELDRPALDITPANADVAFIGSLIDRLERDLCLDMLRTYATGLSNGAWMASALPCALGDRIAAIAPVAGVVDFGAACHPGRPVPVIAFHGSADMVLPMDGGFDPELVAELRSDTGGSFGDDNPIWAVPIRERVTGLAVRDGCGREPVSDRVSADEERLTWSCPAAAADQLVVVDGGGHDWPRPDPGASVSPGATPSKVDATRLIWEFFKEHPLHP